MNELQRHLKALLDSGKTIKRIDATSDDGTVSMVIYRFHLKHSYIGRILPGCHYIGNGETHVLYDDGRTTARVGDAFLKLEQVTSFEP